MAFDPYRVWLGIPADRRPPTHYDILSLEPGEADEQVIRAAADQRRNYVQEQRGTGRDKAVSEILHRIDIAVATLIAPVTKTDYDREIGLHSRRANGISDKAPTSIWYQRVTERIYGEGSGIVSTFAGIMAVLVLSIGLMVWFSFQMPWSKIQSADLGNPRVAGQSSVPTTNSDTRKPEESEANTPTPSRAEANPSDEVATPASDVSPWPNDAVPFAGHFYKFFPESISWQEAKLRCETMDGYMTTIQSEAENRFLTKLLRDAGRDAWLGATDKDNEGKWKWVDGTPFNRGFTKWYPKQPNNKKNEEHYLVMWADKADQSANWVDQPITSTFHNPGFICEWDGAKGGESQEKTSASEPMSEERSTAKDVQLMQGEWKCIAGEENGKTQDKTKVDKERRRLFIEGNALTMDRIGGSWIGTFQIDDTNGQFDWSGKSSNRDAVEWIGIYELNGNQLKLCFIFQRNNKAKRPTKFKALRPTEPGLAHAFYTFERE